MIKIQQNLNINFLLELIIHWIDYLRLKIKNNSLFIIKRFFINLRAKLIFIIEDADWVINFVGKNIVLKLNELNLIPADYDRLYFGKNKIIHFGSINCLIRNNMTLKLKHTNKNILTIFHISPNFEIKNYINYFNKRIDLIHTSNNLTKNKLIELGVKKEKIVIIPLGIDLSNFKMYNSDVKKKLKIKYNLPLDKIIIGSFQKDGVGWGEGSEAKYIKGPDIFCEVIKILNQKYNIHVFLTGPARGFVKENLKKNKISFTHVFISNYKNIVECYNTLDLYLITSRIEGGPLALLEGMASGIPIVSTKVGMGPDIIQNGINGFLTDVNNVEELFNYSSKIINDNELRNKIIKNGLNTVKNFNWEKITKQYYNKLYKKFLK